MFRSGRHARSRTGSIYRRSAPAVLPRPQGKELRRFGQAIPLALAFVLTMGVTAALADEATDTDISINGGAATTDSLAVTVTTQPVHCPPGGDMSALEVSLSNDESNWTIVKSEGVAWPTGGCSGGIAPEASFNWNLAAGGAGLRTVYAAFRHGNDTVNSSDSIQYVVASYTFDGFYSPVNGNSNGTSTFNVSAKAGQGIALKWNLSNSALITDVSKYSARSVPLPCDLSGTAEATVATDDAGGSGFRYDADGEQTIYVWKTVKSWAQTCRTLEISYDGTLVAELDVLFTK